MIAFSLEPYPAITGMPNRFEIWAREKWMEEIGRFEKEGFEDPELEREIKSLRI